MLLITDLRLRGMLLLGFLRDRSLALAFILLLVCINELLDDIKSEVRLLANDTVIYISSENH